MGRVEELVLERMAPLIGEGERFALLRRGGLRQKHVEMRRRRSGEQAETRQYHSHLPSHVHLPRRKCNLLAVLLIIRFCNSSYQRRMGERERSAATLPFPDHVAGSAGRGTREAGDRGRSPG